MNKIRAIQELNKKELENGIKPEASWHTDYRDTAFIYFGGLPYELTEGDVITIFSQYGEPCFVKLARDKETGKSKGFGWLKYEDQRSTDLAVDNLGGADVAGRKISVDHARYKAKDEEEWAEFDVSWQAMMRREGKWVSDEEESDEEERRRPRLREEEELEELLREHDDEDPMKAYLVEEKKKEVDEARRRTAKKAKKLRSGRDESRDDQDKRRRHERPRDRSRDGDRGSRRGEDDRERRRHRSPESRSSRRSRHGDDDKTRRRSRSRSPRRHRTR